MKKLLSFVMLLLISYVGYSQGVAYVNATGTTGSYKTGHVFNTTAGSRVDNQIQVNYVGASTSSTGDKRGWAVFNLAGIVPAGATITGVSLRISVSAVLGTGTAATAVYGYNGDLSTVTSPSLLNTYTMSGSPFNTSFWGSTAGTSVLPLNSAGVTFVTGGVIAGSSISMCFVSTSNTAQTFYINGFTAAPTLQPQLQISYTCPGVSGVAARATPSTVCEGETFTLSGSASGATRYSWAGPAGFTSTDLTPSRVFTASTTTAGIYTFTATSGSGCPSVNTVNVTVNPAPAPIGGPTTVCETSTITVTETMTGGSWSISPLSVATITTGGIVTGVSNGVAIVTFTSSAGCIATLPIGVGQADTIIGRPFACVGQPVRLTNRIPGGYWTSSNSLIANIGSSTGIMTGGIGGSATISYSTGCGTPVTMTVTTVSPPPPIGNAGAFCEGTNRTLTNSSTVGGLWRSVSTSIATIVDTSGVAYGVNSGTSVISYTDNHGCWDTAIVTVLPLPRTITGSLLACPGTSTTLFNATAGGRWSTTSALLTVDSVSGVVTGIAAGTGSITYTNSCGIATTTVTINPPPPAITGTFVSCANTSANVYNAVPGGFWSSANTSIAVAAAGFGVISGVSAGTTTITYTALTGCIATATFTVNRIPGPINGTRSVCPGFTTLLTDTSLNGRWSSFDTNIAIIDTTTGLVRGRVASSTIITYTLRSTGCYNTAPFVVNPLPDNIYGTTEYCSIISDTLKSATAGGTWTSNNTAMAAINPATGVVTAGSAGSPTITYTLPTGCYVTRRITVHPLPNPPITFDAFSNTLSVPNIYRSYQWYEDGFLMAGANAFRVAGVSNASYTVYVRDTFNCENMSSAYVLTAVAIDEVNKADITIYPNPAKNMVYINAPVALQATITSIDGKLLAKSTQANSIDVSYLPSGMYILNLYNNKGTLIAQQKITKE